MHTDNGLMIAMTTGYYSSDVVSEKSGLCIELSSGTIVQVKPDDDSLVIMMGEGGNSWFQPVFGKPFRAVPHALYVNSDGIKSSTRSWYGKMVLPPSDAVISSSNGYTYQKLREYQLKQLGGETGIDIVIFQTNSFFRLIILSLSR